LLDDFGQLPQQLSNQLMALLADAEQRVKSESAAAPRTDAKDQDASIELTPEVAAAFARPVGEYSAENVETSPPRPGSTPPKSWSVTRDATDVPTGTGWGPPESDRERRPASLEASPPTEPRKPDPSRSSPGSEPPGEASPRSKSLHGELPGSESAGGDAPFDPVVDRTSKTRPPRTAAVAATKRVVTPVPRAPALPSDVWVQSTVERTTAEGTGRGRSDPAPPLTSRSAQPSGMADDHTSGQGNDRHTASVPSPESISTIPPSTGLGPATAGASAPVTESPGRDADPTTRPPLRRDTNAPSHPGAAARPPSEPARSEPDPSSATSGDTDVVELREGTAIGTLASAIRRRFTGAIAFESDRGIRRVVLRDGDLVTVASGIADESLLHYLVHVGVLSKDASAGLGHRVPSFGRHAGAALIAGGYLPQDQLWPTLRAHAEFILGRALSQTQGVAALEATIPERLRAEPSVFGGATGSEVLVDICRTVVPPDTAVDRLGGEHVRLRRGEQYRLLEECALGDDERAALATVETQLLGDALTDAPSEEFACVLYALRELSVLTATRPVEPRSQAATRRAADPLDDEAIRHAVRARRALVDEADYFTLLGVPRSATGYQVRRAFIDLRRAFDPSLVLRPATLDLRDDVDVILEVLHEAYDVLREPTRRERYRRALEAPPPGVH
jgi:hypothetical protein